MSCVSAPRTDPQTLPSGQWQLDTHHASVTWQVRHFGLSWVTGRFDTFDASLDFDPENPERAQLSAAINAASVSTGNPEFDDTLRGSGWLNADLHPQIFFELESLTITGEQTGTARGNLTLKGQMHSVDMMIEFYGGNYNFLESREAIGFGADMVIERTDFGIGFLPDGIAGDTIRIRIEAEFLLQR